MTMTHISTITVGPSGAASIEFTGIPQTGTDLLLVVSTRTTFGANAGSVYAQFNADSGSNYSYRFLRGSGSSATSSSGTFGYAWIGASAGSTSTANTFSNVSVYIANCTTATAKSISVDSVIENNATATDMKIFADSWSGTAAITSISLTPDSGTFVQYSTASLYTITKGSGGATVS